jgi:hypothetical protein
MSKQQTQYDNDIRFLRINKIPLPPKPKGPNYKAKRRQQISDYAYQQCEDLIAKEEVEEAKWIKWLEDHATEFADGVCSPHHSKLKDLF